MCAVQKCIPASVTCCIVAHLLASCCTAVQLSAEAAYRLEHLNPLSLHAGCKRGPAVFWLCGGGDGQRRMPGHHQLFRGQHERDIGQDQ